jgi:palmitoyltransferase
LPNADPTIVNSQGFNTLHLVTHSSLVMPLLYLLHQLIAVDAADSVGHISLNSLVLRSSKTWPAMVD